MYPIQEVSNIDIAFPAKVKHLMPPMAEIPDEFKDWNSRNKWNKLFLDWFYSGITDCHWKPKPSVDTQKALRHITCIIGSFEPQHEHKEAAVAYLLSEWFEDVTYKKTIPSSAAPAQPG